MICKQCGRDLSEDNFLSYTDSNGETKRFSICKACDKFNCIVADAYNADTRTDEQQYIVDEAIKVYDYQYSNGLRPRGRLAREVMCKHKRDTFFEEYVKANTPKEDNTNEEV